MHLEEIVSEINKTLPFQYALDGDKVGIQIENSKTKIKKILVVLEINDSILQECLEKKIDCIVTFHPLIYRPLQTISLNERVGRLVAKLLKADIAVVSVHTSYDVFAEGTNKIICDLLGLEKIEFLIENSSDSNFGLGIIAQPKKKLKIEDLAEKVSKTCFSPVKFNFGKSKEINRIAIVGGSGSSFIENAIAKNCDAFITADLTYHNFHRCDGIMSLIDLGHYEMEQFVPIYLARLLQKVLGKVSVIQTNTHTNPINYYPVGDFRKKQIHLITN